MALDRCDVKVRDLDAAHADARRRVPRAHRQPHRAERGRKPSARPLTTTAPILQEVAHDRREPHHRRRLARRAGQARRLRVTTSRHRRARPAGRPARPRGGHPAGLHRPVLLRREHRRRCRTSPRAASPGFDFKAFQMPTAILLGVTGISRRRALVLDVQNGYFDRLLLTPGAAHLDPARPHGRRRRRRRRPDRADPDRRLRPRRALRTGAARRGRCSCCSARLWSLAFAGFGYAIALKTGNPAAVNSSFLLFFPFLFLTSVVRAPRSAVGLARHRRRVEPGHVPARGAALARSTAAGRGTTSARRCSPS